MKSVVDKLLAEALQPPILSSSAVFGERMRYARILRKMTQQELADKVGGGCLQGNINAIESRKSTKSKYARDIAIALGVRLDWLLYGNGEMEADNQDTLTQLTDYSIYSKQEAVPISHYSPQERSKIVLNVTLLEDLGISPEDVRTAKLDNDLMIPVINEGSDIAFDTRRTQIKNGKLYAMLSNGLLYCAYLQLKPSPQGEQVRLFYANSSMYPDEVMSMKQFLETYTVLGHVFWWSNTQTW